MENYLKRTISHRSSVVGDQFETVPASFGIVPSRHIPPGVKVFDTMNARSESVADKRSFSDAWKNLQLCLIACRSGRQSQFERYAVRNTLHILREGRQLISCLRGHCPNLGLVGRLPAGVWAS